MYLCPHLDPTHKPVHFVAQVLSITSIEMLALMKHNSEICKQSPCRGINVAFEDIRVTASTERDRLLDCTKYEKFCQYTRAGNGNWSGNRIIREKFLLSRELIYTYVWFGIYCLYFKENVLSSKLRLCSQRGIICSSYKNDLINIILVRLSY